MPVLDMSSVREAIERTCAPEDASSISLTWHQDGSEIIAVTRYEDPAKSGPVMKRIKEALEQDGYVCDRSRTRVYVGLVRKEFKKPDFICTR